MSLYKYKSGVSEDLFLASDNKSEALAIKIIESKATSDIKESKKSQGLDSVNVCARSGAKLDSL